MQFEGAGNGVMVGDVLRMFGGIAMNAELSCLDILAIEQVVDAVVEGEFVVGDAESGGGLNESVVEVGADPFVDIGDGVVVEIAADDDAPDGGASNGGVDAVALSRPYLCCLAEFAADLFGCLWDCLCVFCFHEFLHLSFVVAGQLIGLEVAVEDAYGIVAD